MPIPSEISGRGRYEDSEKKLKCAFRFANTSCCGMFFGMIKNQFAWF